MLRKIGYQGLLIFTIVFFILFFFLPVFHVLKGGITDTGTGKYTLFYLQEEK